MPAIDEQARHCSGGPERITEMNPKHHISVHPETRHSDGDEGPAVFHIMYTDTNRPGGKMTYCGQFLRYDPERRKGSMRLYKATGSPDGNPASVMCPLCELLEDLFDDYMNQPENSDRRQFARRFITELITINKLGKEQQ